MTKTTARLANATAALKTAIADAKRNTIVGLSTDTTIAFLDRGQVTDRAYEMRYNANEMAEVFTIGERQKLNAGKVVVRKNGSLAVSATALAIAALRNAQ